MTQPRNTIHCPACDTPVAPENIDHSALSVEAKEELARSDRKKKFKDTRTAVDELRREKAARMRGKGELPA